MRGIVANGGRVLFVGTKRQAQEKLPESAKRCGQYYVNHRWLGGMMTNWKTVTNSINQSAERTGIHVRSRKLPFTKKEALTLRREMENCKLSIGGIKDMADQPDAIFIIDTGTKKTSQ